MKKLFLFCATIVLGFSMVLVGCERTPDCKCEDCVVCRSEISGLAFFSHKLQPFPADPNFVKDIPTERLEELGRKCDKYMEQSKRLSEDKKNWKKKAMFLRR